MSAPAALSAPVARHLSLVALVQNRVEQAWTLACAGAVEADALSRRCVTCEDVDAACPGTAARGLHCACGVRFETRHVTSARLDGLPWLSLTCDCGHVWQAGTHAVGMFGAKECATCKGSGFLGASRCEDCDSEGVHPWCVRCDVPRGECSGAGRGRCKCSVACGR